MNRRINGTLAGLGLFALVAGCAAQAGDEGTASQSEAIVNCPRGICPDPPPKPPPPPKKVLKSISIPASTLQTLFGLAFGNTEIQVNQAPPFTPTGIVEAGCVLDYSAEEACRQACEGGGGSSITISDCLKSCSSDTYCNYVCGTQEATSYITFGPALTGKGSQPCNPNDCQTCVTDSSGNRTEPAIYDRALSLPYPIYTSSGGNCVMTNLHFDIQYGFPVSVDIQGIHLALGGTSGSPALSCDGVVPDMDFGDIVLILNLLPGVSGGALTMNGSAQFHAAVTAHNPAAAGLVWIGDAQSKVQNMASSDFSAQISQLDGPIAQGVDAYIRSQLAAQGATLTAYDSVGTSSGGTLVVEYH
jgi:hypothetical protein